MTDTKRRVRFLLLLLNLLDLLFCAVHSCLGLLLDFLYCGLWLSSWRRLLLRWCGLGLSGDSLLWCGLLLRHASSSDTLLLGGANFATNWRWCLDGLENTWS
jgi:hypothetical protein